MDSTKSTLSRTIALQHGSKPSYLPNNLTRSDNYLASVKNGFSQIKINLYKLSDLENESLSEVSSCKSIDFDPKEREECVHLKYHQINGEWYLLVGFVGHLEVFNENGNLRYTY